MPPKRKAATKAESDEDYDSWTCDQLRAKLRSLGLPTSGQKSVLVEAVSKALSGGADSGAASTKKGGKTTKRTKKEESEDDDEEEADAAPAAEPAAGARISSRVQAKQKAEAEKEKEVGKWKEEGSLIYLASSGLEGAEEIYSFDMDDTLIETKSGKTFAVSRQDWQWLYPSVPAKLKELHDKGVKVVIFTNQGGINGKNGFDRTKANQIKGKIEDLIEELGFPVQAFIATTDDIYRKPATPMWDFMVKNCNDDVKPNLAKCAFVGDAAGRAVGWKAGRKKDFSCSDRKFAHNIGIQFFTPEEFFLGEKPAAFDWDSVALDSIPRDGVPCEGPITSPKQEMALFVGYPAAGKSTFARTHFVPAGYVHVNRDTLSTQAKCLKAAEEALQAGKSVVIDNTNPQTDVRATYIHLAKSYKVPVRCFYFQTSEELAKHMNYYRERTAGVAHVPRIGYAVYKKNFKEPSLSEGFSEIKKVKFVLNCKNADEEKAFKQYC